MEFKDLKKYMQLKDSYFYEFTLLCRYSHQNFHFRFLKFSSDASWKKSIKSLAILLIRLILSWKHHSIYYVGCLSVLFLLIIAFFPYPFIWLGIVAFVILWVYIPLLIISEEISRFEILNVTFENSEHKAVEDICLKDISLYDDEQKLKTLMIILNGTLFIGVEQSRECKDKMGAVLNYTSSRLPGYDVIKAFVKQGNQLFLIN